MKIAVGGCAYPPYQGGIGNAAARHARGLTAMGHSVVVFAPDHAGGAPQETVDGVVIRRMRPLVRHGTSAFMPALIRAVRPFDALYLHYPFYGGAEAAALGARFADIPYVAFFHMDVEWETGWRSRFISLYERTAAPWILKNAARVLVSSHDYAENSSLARYRLPNLQERPYGIDTARFFPGEVPEEDMRRLGLNSRKQTLLFVGGMDRGHAFKGVPELLSAFAAAKLSDRAQLALIGDGELRPGFEARARQLGIGNDTVFLGRAPDEDLLLAYRAARATVLPSTTTEEAFGIVLIEAMASGSPVIASNLPGVRRVADPENGGVLVPPRDVDALREALTRMVDDDGLHRNLSARATEAATQKYSFESERSDLDALFREVAPRGSAR